MLLMFLFFSTNFYQNVFACIRFCFFTPISLVLLLLFRTFCKLHLSALFLLFLFSFFPTISMWPSIHLFRQSVRNPRLHWVISRTKNIPQWFVLNVGLCKRCNVNVCRLEDKSANVPVRQYTWYPVHFVMST